MVNELHNSNTGFNKVSIFLLVLLWIYASISKLLDYPHFIQEMHSQLLPQSLRTLLVAVLPVAEIILAILLSIRSTQLFGLVGSLMVLLLFSLYIGVLLFHPLKRVPCPCGGLIEHIGLATQLIFNLFFIALIVINIFFIKRKELRQQLK
jgi:putative oxidoreductase